MDPHFTVFVDSPHGESTLSVVQGDIATQDADVHVVSSHASPHIPLEGAALAALARAWSVDPRLCRTEPLITPPYTIDGTPRHGVVGTHWVDVSEDEPERRLLLVRFPNARRVEDPAHLYETALHSLLGSVAYLEVQGRLDGVESLAMTVLAGDRVRSFDPRQILKSLLAAAQRLLRMTTELRHLRLVVYDIEDAARYREALEDLLQPPRLAVPDAAILAVRTELRQVLESPVFRTPSVQRAFAEELEAALGSDELSVLQLGQAGRKLAEFVADTACATFPSAQARLAAVRPRNRTLMQRLLAMQDDVAPWVVSHLHNLRTLGNEAAHYKGTVGYVPAGLTTHEALALLVSIHRCALFWSDHLATGQAGD